MTMFDIIVCGAGTSGVCAAIAASRMGAKTLVLDREASPGGTITHAMVYPLMTFHATPDLQIVKGIAQEIVDRAIAKGTSRGHVPDPIGCAATFTMVTPEDFSCIAQELMTEAGVITRYDTTITEVAVADQQITSLTVQTGAEFSTVSGKVIIDATGDGTIAALGGVPFTSGRLIDGKTQPMTLEFSMNWVDLVQLRSAIQEQLHDFVFSKAAQADLNAMPALAVAGFFKPVRAWQSANLRLLFRDRVLIFELPRPGSVSINMTRILDHDGTDPEACQAAYALGFEQISECVEFLHAKIPGFQQAVIDQIAPRIGIRETRHIKGRYTLKATDVLEGRKFDDGIAAGAFPIDIHSPDGKSTAIHRMQPGTWYTIPYRCLVPENLTNLLVTGRAISATHEANASARLSPTCMALGHASGIAAALSIVTKCQVGDIDVSYLRAILKSQNAVF